MLSAWLSAFALTQLVEMPIYRRGLRVSWLAAFAASAITHPIVWFAFFSPAFEASYEARVVSAELFAWLAEAAWFRFALQRPRALLWSLLANGASVCAGFALRALFDWP